MIIEIDNIPAIVLKTCPTDRNFYKVFYDGRIKFIHHYIDNFFGIDKWFIVELAPLKNELWVLSNTKGKVYQIIKSSPDVLWWIKDESL